MKRHGNWSPMKSSSRDRTLLFITCVTGLMIVSNSLHANASPTWETQNSITDFGRNIRQLPCVSRRTGETGTCMFAYSCAKVNGTHLGTCIDRFYFGSCCKTPDNVEVEVNEPDNFLTNYDNEVASVTGTGIKFGQPSTDRIQASSSSYKPTSQFSVHPSLSTTSTSTSRNQYTQHPSSTAATEGPTKPAYSFGTTATNSVAPAYSSTQTAKPLPSSTSAKPTAKPTSSFRPPIRDQATTAQKAKPQTPKPTVQFTVPGSTVGTTSYQAPSSTAAAVTQEGLKPTSTYTAVTSMRPLNATTVTATFSTTKPVVKPSSSSSLPPSTSTTYKSTTSPSTSTASASASPPHKAKPQTAKPVTGKPKPSSAKPSTEAASAPYSESTTNGIRATVETVTRPSTVTVGSSSATGRPDQTISYGPTTVTSTSPTLVTWTTLDKVPVIPPDHTKPPTASPVPSMTHKPTGLDGSTLPSWVKLPVETHEPNTVATMPAKESSTTSGTSSASNSVSYNFGSSTGSSSSSSSSSSISSTSSTSSSSSPSSISSSSSTDSYSPTTLMSKPNTVQSIADNELIVTSSGINNNNYSSTANPSTSISSSSSTAQMSSTVVDPADSNEAGSAPLNMSNYKDVCGRRLFPTARIVGGEKVSFGKWPWQISLRQWRTSTYLHKCGAALFNENWAVTAAHCVENVPPSDLLLRLGEHDLSIEEEPYGYEERRIQIVASHPQFDPRTFEYDLALLRFYEPVKFQPNIVPVCVPDDDANFVGTSAYVTGWGRLYEDGPLPSVLQEVTVPVINNSVCETMYRAAGYIEHIPDIFICAGWKKGGFDSCEGDSGGPMVIQRPDKRWLLAGIISWGIGCAEPNQPGVYTRISKFKDWINQILQF